MTEMKLSNNNLKQYIALVCEMEQNKYRQEQAIAQVDSQVRTLSNNSISAKPAEPQKHRKSYSGIIFTPAGIFFSFLAITSFLQAIVLEGIFLGVIGLICLSFAKASRDANKQAVAANARDEDNFNRAMIAHKNSVNAARVRTQMAESLKVHLAGMRDQLSAMENDLERVYSCNIIYPTYRNLVAVSSFYDYLFSNRCAELEGHEGAYNIFNTESRLDKIIVRLDDISRQLESIKYSQSMLYNGIKESNEAIGRLQGTMSQTNQELQALSTQAAVSNAQLGKLAYNTELIRFNAEQERREIELRNRADGIYPFRFAV